MALFPLLSPMPASSTLNCKLSSGRVPHFSANTMQSVPLLLPSRLCRRSWLFLLHHLDCAIFPPKAQAGKEDCSSQEDRCRSCHFGQRGSSCIDRIQEVQRRMDSKPPHPTPRSASCQERRPTQKSWQARINTLSSAYHITWVAGLLNMRTK